MGLIFRLDCHAYLSLLLQLVFAFMVLVLCLDFLVLYYCFTFVWLLFIVSLACVGLVDYCYLFRFNNIWCYCLLV